MNSKILFLTNTLALGGLEKVNVEVANGLSEIFNTTLYSLKGDSYGYEFSKRLSYKEGNRSKKNVLLHPYKLMSALFGKRLIQKKNLNFTVIKKDLDFSKYSTVILSEADILYAKEIKKIHPTINIVGWIHNTFDSYKDKYMKDSYSEFINNLKYIDTAVVLTDSDRKSYSKIHNNVKKINNPLTIPLETSDVFSLKKENKICFVGRLEYKFKGLDYLIKLAENLPDGWKISIAGDGYQRKQFEEEIMQKKLMNKFEIKGPLKGEELAKHYQECKLFVLTSRWEGFGLVVTEAMYYGLPVVAFDSDGPREILGEKSEFGILVENGNHVELSKQVLSLINDEERCNYYAKQSLIRKQDYEIDKIITEWLKILK
jgi:Glycosyltransferase